MPLAQGGFRAVPRERARWVGWLVWAVASALVTVWLCRQALVTAQDAFETDARIAHRLLSQRAAQHDAVLATLALLQPGGGDGAEQRLPSVYPQILAAISRSGDAPWPAALAAANLEPAEQASRQQGRPVFASADWATGRFWLVMAARPASYALQLDARAMVPEAEWPIAPDSPVRVALAQGGQRLALHAGQGVATPWHFAFSKRLAAESQPFDVVLERDLPWSALPWGRAAGMAVGLALLLRGLASAQRQRRDRRRAEDLLRLGQVARLNTLGELAAGMAHELNQPLTAVLANTQAAGRLLDDDPPDLATARTAMTQAAQQARRASDVVARLRRTVERPDLAAPVQAVRLDDAVRNALYLLEPECRRRAVQPVLESAPPVTVLADPVALEQILHNLLMNALQALEGVDAGERRLVITLQADAAQGQLTVADTGPGIAPEALPHLFEPFYSTREGGLGLGLSLCESLAQGMGGQLQARHAAPRGAAFVLTLPLAATA